jgi:hypothetical protein
MFYIIAVGFSKCIVTACLLYIYISSLPTDAPAATAEGQHLFRVQVASGSIVWWRVYGEHCLLPEYCSGMLELNINKQNWFQLRDVSVLISEKGAEDFRELSQSHRVTNLWSSFRECHVIPPPPPIHSLPLPLFYLVVWLNTIVTRICPQTERDAFSSPFQFIT